MSDFVCNCLCLHHSNASAGSCFWWYSWTALVNQGRRHWKTGWKNFRKQLCKLLQLLCCRARVNTYHARWDTWIPRKRSKQFQTSFFIFCLTKLKNIRKFAKHCDEDERYNGDGGNWNARLCQKFLKIVSAAWIDSNWPAYGGKYKIYR